MKKLLAIIIVLLVVAVGIYVYRQFRQTPNGQNITSFQECADAGYPVMESFPEQCRTPDGRIFTRGISPTPTSDDIADPAQLEDLITVENPLPNQIVSSPLEITGEARGTWYFEANFPIELFDANGTSLGTVVAQAEGEWMTENFVPFYAELQFDRPTTETGELVIQNANPSGLAENDKQLRVPVRFSHED